jgi:hypothetical protein
MTSLFDAARNIRLPKRTDPEKLRRATLSVLAIRRTFFEDAMRHKDERMMTIHAEWMDRLERMAVEIGNRSTTPGG